MRHIFIKEGQDRNSCPYFTVPRSALRPVLSGRFFICLHKLLPKPLGLVICPRKRKSARMTEPSDATLNNVFERTKTIAVVRFSMNPARPSHYVSKFLVEQGYRVIPVNPGHAGKDMFGTTIRASLADIDEPVDMVDVFRRSDAVMDVLEDALANLDGLQIFWTQLGVIHDDARQKAEAAGLTVIMNRCPKIEIPRLGRLR